MTAVLEGHMRKLTSIGLLVSALALASACQPAAEKTAEAAAPALAVYDAKTFYDTTAVSMSAATGIGFSPDGSKILIANDSTGVFNAYALPVAGGAPEQLTSSTTTATFAVTYFPGDDRVMVSTDGGGDELTHLYVRGADGALKDITPGA